MLFPLVFFTLVPKCEIGRLKNSFKNDEKVRVAATDVEKETQMKYFEIKLKILPF